MTYLNIMHSVVTFYLFHWKKGSPVQADQGDYDSLTWWEQMDGEVQNTSNRKFFTSVPAALFLLAAHVNQYRSNVVYVNFTAVRACHTYTHSLSHVDTQTRIHKSYFHAQFLPRGSDTNEYEGRSCFGSSVGGAGAIRACATRCR